jgi:arginase
MNSNSINIFEFPPNLGLKKTDFEIEPGVRFLPSWLKKNQLYDQIMPEHVFTLEPPPYSMDLDYESSVINTNEIILYALQQYVNYIP